MMTRFTLLFALLFAGAACAATPLDALVTQVASSSQRVIDGGGLLTAAELTELEQASRAAAPRGIEMRFVTLPQGIAPAEAQSRLGDALGLTAKDVLILAGRDGAFARAPALAGEADAVTGAFQESRRDFAVGTARGMRGFGERVTRLVEERRAKETGLSRLSVAAIVLLLLAFGGRMVWSLRSAGAARTARESADLEGRVNASSALLYQLGVATEELPAGHELYLEAWRRFGHIRKNGGTEEFLQLDRFLQEAVDRVRTGRCC